MKKLPLGATEFAMRTLAWLTITVAIGAFASGAASANVPLRSDIDEVVKTLAAPCAAATYMATRLADGTFDQASLFFQRYANKRRAEEIRAEFVRAVIDGATTEDALVVYADRCVRLWQDATNYQ